MRSSPTITPPPSTTIGVNMIPYGKHYIDEADIRAVVEVLRGKPLTQGPAIDAFEKAIASYVGARYAVAVASATAGLHLAAIAAGVGPGKTLITSPITFIASANAALYCGGQVAFADIDAETINMCPRSLQAIMAKTKNVQAIIPVHFAGLPCDMPAIKKIADEFGALVIEDAAHALGATYPDGSRVGCCSNSLMTVFSFHPVKAIAAGEGGMITTNDERTYRKLLRLRSHGINKLDDQIQLPHQALTDNEPNPWYYEMQELGYHYRITDIQCALGLSQFEKLDRFIMRRRELVAAYDTAFAAMNSWAPAQRTGRAHSGHHLYVLRIDFPAKGLTRARLMTTLRSKNIGTQVHYIPVPNHPYYQKLGFKPEDYPNSKNYYQSALSIPLFYELTDLQQKEIIHTLKDLLP